MNYDQKTIEMLALDFLRKRGTNYITGELLPGDNSTKLGSVDLPFAALYVRDLHLDHLVADTTNADRVGGFSASATPKPNTLLPLDGSGKFPLSVLGNVLPRTGGVMTGNLDMAPGVLVDGVDVGLFKAEYDLYVQQHGSGGSTVALEQLASADGYGTRPAHSAMRLRKSVHAGNGLMGGGMLDSDVSLSVRVGNGLVLSGIGAVTLGTPGALSAASTNAIGQGHTHEVQASSEPTGESLLKTTSDGWLRLSRLSMGDADKPGGGSLRASGDLQGRQVLADQNAFVGNNLTVGESLLVTARDRQAVYVNKQANILHSGALHVHTSGSSQRGVVVQGSAGQIEAAPLLSVVDAAGDDLFVVRADGQLESGGDAAVVGGQIGWRITREGDAEFRNISARGEMHTSIFSANEIHATGGTLAVMGASVVGPPVDADDNVVNSTFTLVIPADHVTPGACAFALNDVLRIKLITGLGEN